MTGESVQSKAAAQQSELASSLSARLAGIAIPGLESMIGQGGALTKLFNSTNSGQTLSSADSGAYQSALSSQNSSYRQAGNVNNEAINYGALRSGQGRLSGSGGPVNSALGQTAQMLGRDQFIANQNLKFASNSAGMANYNKILNLFGQGTQTALGLGGGAMGAAGGAIGGLNSQTQGGSILGGAGAGAALGTAILPGWGTAIGAVGGGIVGALTAP